MITLEETAKLNYFQGEAGQRVSDLIGQTYKEWNRWEPVFINAATGSGKTTFIIEKLLEEAGRNNKKILFFVNRNALKQQLIIDFIKIQKQKDIFFKESSVSYERDCPFTWQKIGKVMVVSYQSAIKFFKYSTAEGTDENSFMQEHNYVVFDECHFFMSDAEFNNATDLILDACVNNCQKLTRIYMSATMDQMFNILSHAEKLNGEHPFFLKYQCVRYLGLFPNRLQEQIKKYSIDSYCRNFEDFNILERNGIIKEFFCLRKNGFFYCIPENYSKYNFCFFNSEKNCPMMINIIKKSKEKFLIFVASKITGKQLNECFDDSIFITSESNSLFSDIITNKGTFKNRVLIATKVLDNGINISSNIDKGGVRNIVLDSFFNEIDMKQMIGRLRGKNKVNVYLREISKNNVVSLLKRKEDLLEVIENYSKISSILEQGKILEKYKIPFREHDNKLVINRLYKGKIKEDIIILKYYMRLISDSDGAVKSYNDIVLAWFGKNCDEVMLCENVDNDIKNEYIKIISKYSVQEKSDEETYQEYFAANQNLCDTLKGTIFVKLAERLLDFDGSENIIKKNSDALKKIQEVIDRYNLPFRIDSKAASNGRTKETNRSFIVRT